MCTLFLCGHYPRLDGGWAAHGGTRALAVFRQDGGPSPGSSASHRRVFLPTGRVCEKCCLQARLFAVDLCYIMFEICGTQCIPGTERTRKKKIIVNAHQQLKPQSLKFLVGLIWKTALWVWHFMAKKGHERVFSSVQSFSRVRLFVTLRVEVTFIGLSILWVSE